MLSASTTWSLVHIDTVDAAEVLLSSDQSVRVGLWAYDSDLLHSERFSALRARHRLVQWIALLPPAATDDSRIAAFVTSHFFDYLTVPVDPERLCEWMGHAHGMSDAVERVCGLPEAAAEEEQMVGTSEPMRQFFRDIRKVAASDAPVFISGESGTGKELAAKAIHERSSRAKYPFVPVDCGATAPSLIHSELFGYERGAFTGAAQRRAGRIEVAQGGTLFLDEIGDLPLDLQSTLLRFLEQSTIQRVGGVAPIKVNVRVIAATHVDLEKAVKQGRFREDLYFRLNVLRLRAPALRERPGDIEVLARYFLSQFATQSRKRVMGYTSEALDLMRQHGWPGNVRELINRIRKAVVMSDGPWITPRDIDLERRTLDRAPVLQLDAVREIAERQAVDRALKLCGNNHSAAARVLGVSRPTFYRLLQRHGQLASRQTRVEALTGVPLRGTQDRPVPVPAGYSAATGISG